MNATELAGDVENHSYHNGRDSYGRAMGRGKYMMTRAGGKPVQVQVVEDSISGELSVVSTVDGQQVNQRLDECAADVVFSKIVSTANESERKLESIRLILQGSEECRKDLDAFEAELASELGCGVGDGSPLADEIMAAVRDGRGSPYGLMQAAGLV